MATWLQLSLVLSEYDIYDDSTTFQIELTERQAQIVLSLFLLSTQRQAWNILTDAEWDNLDSELAEIIEKFYD